MPTIKGTASVADSRARQKALKRTKFPRNFCTSVNLEKVNKPILTQWIEQKVTSILGFEDEIVSFTAINLFLPSHNESPDPRKAQLDLAGFLGDQAVSFSAELWKLMLEAQTSTSGISQTLLEQKKKEMTERMTRKNQGEQQKEQTVRENRSSQIDQDRGRDRNRNNHSSSEIQISVQRTHGILSGHGLSNKQDGKHNQNTTALDHSAQFESKLSKNPRKGSSEDIVEKDIDQFGRAHPAQRSRNMQRNTRRDQHNRNRPYNIETSRRSQCRSRSRERYDHDRERDFGYKRRSDDRHRVTNDGTRRFDDRRYNSNHHDDRSAYHHQYHRRHHHHYDHDRHHDGECGRNRYHDYDRERGNLERRLTQLKKQCSGLDKRNDNRNMHKIDNDMKGVQDTIYELERHRRRYTSSRDDYSHSRSHRGRSPSYEYRRGGRLKRSNSANSDRSNSMQRSRDDYSAGSAGSGRGSHNSYSPSPEKIKKKFGSGNPKRHNGRRCRSYSSSEGSEQSSKVR